MCWGPSGHRLLEQSGVEPNRKTDWYRQGNRYDVAEKKPSCVSVLAQRKPASAHREIGDQEIRYARQPNRVEDSTPLFYGSD